MNFEWRPLVSYPKAPTSVRWSGSHAAGLWWGVLDGVIRGSGLVVVVVVVGGSHPESCRNVVRSFNPLRWLEGDITSPGHGTLSAWTIWRFCPTQCRISPLLLLLFSFPLLLSSPPLSGAVTASPRSRRKRDVFLSGASPNRALFFLDPQSEN